MDVFAALKQNPLMRGFTDDGVRIIQTATLARQLDAGSPIFVERMMGESAFLVAQGEVSLYVNRGGGEREVGVLMAPDAFGELSLMNPGPRRISARARTTLWLLEINRRDFLKLQVQRPQACVKLLMNAAERFAQKSNEAGPSLERLLEIL